MGSAAIHRVGLFPTERFDNAVPISSTPTGSFRREQCYSGGPQVFIVCAAGYVQRLDASSTSAAPKPPKYECADDWHDEEDHGIDDDRHIFHRGLGAQ